MSFFNKPGGKRESKWQKKQNYQPWKEEKDQQQVEQVGAEQIFQKALTLPRVLLQDLSIVKEEGQAFKLEINCSH